MIFVTVGAQMPFDRLVRTVDEWAAARGTNDVIAQIGETNERPQHVACIPYLDGPAFRRHIEDADLVVAHAGMGTMLTAFEAGRPLLVLPRRGALQETRNDHQVDTAQAFAGFPGVTVAWTEDELTAHLDALARPRPLAASTAEAAPDSISDCASSDLLEALHDFIHGSDTATNAESS